MTEEYYYYYIINSAGIEMLAKKKLSYNFETHISKDIPVL